MTRDEYLRSVGFWLRDLPWGTRRDLLTELRGHLDELLEGTNLRTQLGPPDQYASDLRAAAGLERRRGPIAFLRARRPRNVILTVAALTLVGLTIGAVVWIDSYQPLAFANAMQFPAGSVDAPAGDSASVVFHNGRSFQFGAEIRNAGRYPVRVLGVPSRGLCEFAAPAVPSVRPESGPFGLAPAQGRLRQLQQVAGRRQQHRRYGLPRALPLSLEDGHRRGSAARRTCDRLQAQEQLPLTTP